MGASVAEAYSAGKPQAVATCTYSARGKTSVTYCDLESDADVRRLAEPTADHAQTLARAPLALSSRD